MRKNNLIANIIVNNLLPTYNQYEKQGFIISLEENHLIIEYKNNIYYLKSKNNLSLCLYNKDKLLKKFSSKEINLVFQYLQEIN